MSRLFISFSGGRTSARMAMELLVRNEYDETIVGFANTGQEDERTLRFIDQCDKDWGFNTVWIEADVQDRGEGTSFKVVDFATASRQGEPFEDVIRKYGIPNPNFRHCTRELKLNPMVAYLRSIGWEKNTYDTAIGIRADEADRVSVNAAANRIIYPLIKWGIRKNDILSWWSTQSFDLDLPEHFGNCVTCWKKSDRKLLTVAADDPGAFDFFARMEAKYPDAGAGDFDRPRHFFRQSRSAKDILTLAKKPFARYVPNTEMQLEMDMLDLGGGCGESCEIFSDYEENCTFSEAAE